METIVISGQDSLQDHIPAWEKLAEQALEPNPYFEPWMLLPAVRSFGQGKDIRFVLIYGDDAGPNSARPLLCAVFPLERVERYLGLPLSAWSIWQYDHCGFTMPLVRKSFAAAACAAFFHWLGSDEARCHVLEWKRMLAEGKLHQVLIDQLHHIGAMPLVSEWYTRALFQRMENEQAYFAAALSGKHRKAMRRRAELLAEHGALEYVVIGPADGVKEWIDSFLRIESSGWKGKEGSAMACTEANRTFFVDVVSGAHRRNRLLMAALRIGGKTVAQNCYFLAGSGAFHFKPAFDEDFARFSPGFHMECELIRYLHAAGIGWMDSCTSADNEMYNRLFVGRRSIQSLIIPIGGGARGLLVSAIPLIRRVKKSAQLMFHRPAQNDDKLATKAEVTS